MVEFRKQARLNVLDRHVKRLAIEIKNLEQLDQRYFWIRLVVLLTGAVGFFIAYQYRQSNLLIGVVLLFLAIFSFVVFLNRRVKRSILRFNLSKSYFFNQLARMQLDWEKIPKAPLIPVSEQHPYASDLNLTGPHSLHQLLNTSISVGGSSRLQDWLLETEPDLDAVNSRQAAVKEMRTLAGFRSRLVLSSNLVSVGDDEAWDGEQLVEWLHNKVEPKSLLPLLIIL